MFKYVLMALMGTCVGFSMENQRLNGIIDFQKNDQGKLIFDNRSNTVDICHGAKETLLLGRVSEIKQSLKKIKEKNLVFVSNLKKEQKKIPSLILEARKKIKQTHTQNCSIRNDQYVATIKTDKGVFALFGFCDLKNLDTEAKTLSDIKMEKLNLMKNLNISFLPQLQNKLVSFVPSGNFVLYGQKKYRLAEKVGCFDAPVLETLEDFLSLATPHTDLRFTHTQLQLLSPKHKINGDGFFYKSCGVDNENQPQKVVFKILQSFLSFCSKGSSEEQRRQNAFSFWQSFFSKIDQDLTTEHLSSFKENLQKAIDQIFQSRSYIRNTNTAKLSYSTRHQALIHGLSDYISKKG